MQIFIYFPYFIFFKAHSQQKHVNCLKKNAAKIENFLGY